MAEKIVASREASPNGGPTRVSIDSGSASLSFVEALSSGAQLYLVENKRAPRALDLNDYPMDQRTSSGLPTNIPLPANNPWKRFWRSRIGTV